MAQLKFGECFHLVVPKSARVAYLLLPDADGVLSAHGLVTLLIRIC